MELGSMFGSVESKECGDSSEKSAVSAKQLYCHRYDLLKINASRFFCLSTSIFVVWSHVEEAAIKYCKFTASGCETPFEPWQVPKYIPNPPPSQTPRAFGLP